MSITTKELTNLREQAEQNTEVLTDLINESWIEYKEEQMNELLSAADEYEHNKSQPETNLA